MASTEQIDTVCKRSYDVKTGHMNEAVERIQLHNSPLKGKKVIKPKESDDRRVVVHL